VEIKHEKGQCFFLVKEYENAVSCFREATDYLLKFNQKKHDKIIQILEQEWQCHLRRKDAHSIDEVLNRLESKFCFSSFRNRSRLKNQLLIFIHD